MMLLVRGWARGHHIRVMFGHGPHMTQRHARGAIWRAGQLVKHGLRGPEAVMSMRVRVMVGMRMHRHLMSRRSIGVPGEIWGVAVQTVRLHQLVSAGRFRDIHHTHDFSSG